MSLDIIISPMAGTDLPAILEIERRSQLEPWTERSFLEELNRIHSYLLVARVDRDKSDTDCPPVPGGIAGYICYWCVADEIQILNIAVHEAFRGKAVGRALLSQAIREGREKKARIVVLEVRKSNAAARRLYENVGFRVVGERPDYYEIKKEPAVLMELKISD